MGKKCEILIIVLFLIGCRPSKENYYSYKVNNYTRDTVKQFIYSYNLISYGDYLFEFKDRVNFISNLYGNSETNSISYDTIGVYLLSLKNKLYYEFDTFTLKSNLVKNGKLSDKEYGFKFNSLDTHGASDVSFTTPKKTMMNNIDCFITEIVLDNKTDNDSIQQTAVLIKKKKFTSLYKINGIKFRDRNYCIVGFNIYDLKKNQSFLQEIESMKPLTEKEIYICTNIIKKSQTYVTDTTKSYRK